MLAAELTRQSTAVADLRSWYTHLCSRTDHPTAMRVLSAAVEVYAPESVARLRRAVTAARRTPLNPYTSVAPLRDAARLLHSLTVASPWWGAFAPQYRGWHDRALQQAHVLLTAVDEARWRRARVLLAGTQQRGCVLSVLPPDLWPRVLWVRRVEA